MVKRMQKYLAGSLVFLFCFVYFSNCGGGGNLPEISTKSEIVSCQYVGLGERNGEPIVDLIFTNNSGKDIKAVYGGLRIVNEAGEIIQSTGFTYTRRFIAGSEKPIPAFAYIPIQPEALDILTSAENYVPMVFELSEVVFEDDESIQF